MRRLLRLAATTIRASSEFNIVGHVLRCSAPAVAHMVSGRRFDILFQSKIWRRRRFRSGCDLGKVTPAGRSWAGE